MEFGEGLLCGLLPYARLVSLVGWMRAFISQGSKVDSGVGNLLKYYYLMWRLLPRPNVFLLSRLYIYVCWWGGADNVRDVAIFIGRRKSYAIESCQEGEFSDLGTTRV